MIVYLPLLFAVIGLVIYLISQTPKPSEIGRIMFWTSLLAFLLRVGPEMVNVLGGKG